MSWIVYVDVQVDVLPAASVTVIVTVVTPALNWLPGSGDCVFVMAQLSVANTVELRSGNGTVQPMLTFVLKFGAHAPITGAVVSTALTVVLHVEVLPAASVTVKVTVWLPRGSEAPAAGDCVIVGDAVQLSETERLLRKSGRIAAQPAATSTSVVGTQLAIVGAVVSSTVMVAVQVVLLPAASVAVKVTTVAPSCNTEPATGD